MSHRVLSPLVALLVLSGCSSAPVDPAREPSAKDPPSANAGDHAAQASSRIDLGNKPSGTDLSFEIGEGSLGFEIVVDAAAGADTAIGVAELIDPTGAVVIADLAHSPHRPVGAGVSSLVYPAIGDAAPTTVPAGTWKVKLGGDSSDPKAGKGGPITPWSGDIHGVVFVQSAASGAFGGGQLDLDLYIPPGLDAGDGAIDVTSAPNDAALKARIDQMFALESSLYGIARGEVRYHAVASSVANIAGYDAIDAANRLATAQGDRPAAQVILTNKLEPDGAGSGEISGITNCLPGAIGVPGTPCSAVIVALRLSVYEDAVTIVHELGHFIGLEHTTEFDDDGFDQLSDTPECTNMSKTAMPSCPDLTNVMFPTSIARTERQVVVSPTQARIMHASPLYHVGR
jgi:hypothetical protein